MPDRSQDELLRAGELLFGGRFPLRGVSGEAWQNELRAAFRRKAMETHPDRASVLRRSEAELAAEFKAVYQAYRLLEALPSAPARRAPAPARPPPPRPAPAPVSSQPVPSAREDHFHAGPVPPRPLRLAEFLYYTGRISFWTWVEAVSWQRQQRPAIGRIAVERGQLTMNQVFEVLRVRRRNRDHQEPFGRYALKLGMLTPRQLEGLLERQRLLQERIGQFFLERRVLAPAELEASRRAMLRHNAQWRE